MISNHVNNCKFDYQHCVCCNRYISCLLKDMYYKITVMANLINSVATSLSNQPTENSNINDNLLSTLSDMSNNTLKLLNVIEEQESTNKQILDDISHIKEKLSLNDEKQYKKKSIWSKNDQQTE